MSKTPTCPVKILDCENRESTSSVRPHLGHIDKECGYANAAELLVWPALLFTFSPLGSIFTLFMLPTIYVYSSQHIALSLIIAEERINVKMPVFLCC